MFQEESIARLQTLVGGQRLTGEHIVENHIYAGGETQRTDGDRLPMMTCS